MSIFTHDLEERLARSLLRVGLAGVKAKIVNAREIEISGTVGTANEVAIARAVLCTVVGVDRVTGKLFVHASERS